MECSLRNVFDKRDAFPFFIVPMPYIDSDIPKSIFYSALVGEFLRIACSSLETMKSYETHNPSSIEEYYPKSFET